MTYFRSSRVDLQLRLEALREASERQLLDDSAPPSEESPSFRMNGLYGLIPASDPAPLRLEPHLWPVTNQREYHRGR